MGVREASAKSLAPSVWLHLGDTGEVDQGEVQHVGGENLEVDGLVVDALVLSRDPLRVGLNLFADLAEVTVPLPRLVEELTPLLGLALGRWGVHQLHHQRPVKKEKENGHL